MKKLLVLSLLTLASLSFSKAVPSAFQIIENTISKTEQINQKQNSNDKDITCNINYGYFDYYYTTEWEESSTYTVLNWKKYANNWHDFRTNYPTFNVSGILIAGFQKWYPIKFNTMGVFNTLYLRPIWTTGGIFIADNKQNNLFTKVSFYTWFDDDNIYWKWSAQLKGNINNFVGVQVDSFVFKAA